MSLLKKYPIDGNPLWQAALREKPLKFPLFVKDGVNMRELQPEVFPALGVAYGVFQLMGFEFVVTSGWRDDSGAHGDGEAFDLRTYHMPLFYQQEAHKRISVALGDRWDVLLEHDPPHLHVERDPK